MRTDASGLIVVKLGGSLALLPALHGVLDVILAAASGPRLVVPGGGPFADTVRAAQAATGITDLAAHRMAILAMQQYGLLLQSLAPGLALVETADEVRALVAEGTAGVWLPWRMIGRDLGIEASWEITSDSLALILATRLAARRLVLVKAAPVPPGIGLTGLAERRLIDRAFPGLATAFAGTIEIVTAGELDLTRAPRDPTGSP